MRACCDEQLRCPGCRGRLALEAAEVGTGEIETGQLRCSDCATPYPILRGLPRFVASANYADNFGFQWDRFQKTQLDSYSGMPISRDRFFRSSGWSPQELANKRVLDVGCGSGRFAEVALSLGAGVVAVDYSSAVDACRRNLSPSWPTLEVVQADIYCLPFEPASFDYIYCLGVLQHTPDVEKAFLALPTFLKAGGKLVVDLYPKLRRNVLWPKYWLRPLTKRMNTRTLFALVNRAAPPLLRLSRCVGRVPVVGRQLRYMVPVANYEGVYSLNEEQLREWAILDTFDMFSPTYDQPQSTETVTQWARKTCLQQFEVFRSGFLICRGSR